MVLDCPLCTAVGGELIWQNEFARVIFADEAAYPGFCRVVLNRHVAEMTDLNANERVELMNIVWAVEKTIRSTLNPDKINLACLGNMVPHLHWHIIPRWTNDQHFPAPIWAEAARQTSHTVDETVLMQLKQQLAQLQP
ncbi:HIT family protein [Deefgea tanakiae]|jgi:diadenosine tetraphosphate (Ap4A) HIT family hydrolase|uniref:HIT family protein n=1 Tax=Deefgea tanakiae TaxID=2865840 RepID=A0ABX8Z722_9NEIS|nr:HIT family protein [Deefgea tanakiae]QZA78387.1 HIT family protein [Deefgea tanakiae]